MDSLGKKEDGPIAKYINRKISTRITLLIVSRGYKPSPNTVSIVVFIFGLIPIYFYISDNPVLAGILIQIASILDGVDGELARILGKTSKFGAFIDGILDRIVDIVAILGASYFSYISLGRKDPLSLAIYFLALSGSLMVSYLHIRAIHYLGKHPVLIGKIPQIASRDVRLFILFIGSVCGLVFEALLVIALVSYVYVFSKFVEICLHVGFKKKTAT